MKRDERRMERYDTEVIVYEEKPVQRAEFVVGRLASIKEQVSDQFIEMGMLLLEVERSRHWESLGYSSFDDFVVSVLGFKGRTARYLMAVYRKLVEELDTPRPLLARVGWSKLKEVAAVATKENVTELVEFASKHRTSDVVKKIKQMRGDVSSEDVRGYGPFTIGLFDDEREVVERALTAAKLEMETDRRGRALVGICADYLAGVDG